MQKSVDLFRVAVTVIAVILAVLLTPPASQRLPEDGFVELLSGYRPAVEADADIVLIEVSPNELSGGTSPVLRGDFFLVLEEMGAKEALLTIPEESFDGASPVTADQREYVKDRLETEFELISQNVSALFDAIRFGSVRPLDAVQFVDDLLVLIDIGGERLLDDILDFDLRRTRFSANARGVFGEDRLGKSPADLGYRMPDYKDTFVVPDYPRAPGDNPLFRRLPLETIYSYVELERELHRFLKAMEEAGYLSGIRPELQPAILYDHAQKLLSELLDEPREKAKRTWLDAKTQYLKSVVALLAGQTEAELDNGFAVLLKEKQEEGQSEEFPAGRIEELRRNLAETFSETRKIFDEYKGVRSLLLRELKGSCCIVGTAPDPLRDNAKMWSAPTAAEAAAARIGSIRSGRYSVIVTGIKEKALLAAPGLVFALLLSVLSMPFVLVIGFFAMIGTAAVCSLIYINTGVLLHPLHAALAPLAAMMATLTVLLLYRIAYARLVFPGAGSRFPRLNRGVTSTLGKRLQAQPQSRYSVMLAVRAPLDASDMLSSGSNHRAAFLKEFHSVVGREVERYGGVIVGTEGPVLLAGFGTPFDRGSSGKRADSKVHLNHGLSVAFDLSGSEAGARKEWSFGLDIGDCSFYLSSVNGYSVEGSPAVYARILSRLAGRYRRRILITEEAAEAAGKEWSVRRLHTLVEKNSGRERAYFALLNGPGN